MADGFWKKLLTGVEHDTTVAEFQARADAETSSAGGFELKVEDVFAITGRGTVATGEVRSGSVAVGANVTVRTPAGKSFSRKVLGIEALGKPRATAVPGDRIGIVIAGVTAADIPTGSVLTA